MGLRAGVTLEMANARSTGCLPGLLGFRVTHIEEGRLDAEIEIRPQILAPNGYLHAATVVALADTACGYGCLWHLPDNMANFTTIELKTNFIGTAREGTIAVIARPVHLGATTQVWDATVRRTADDKSIALFRCTQMLLAAR
ncbi:MAG: PaaI family thioesterase [Casimicrobiaceae bacterium]